MSEQLFLHMSEHLLFVCQEKCESLQQLEQRQKFQKTSALEKADVSTNGLQNSPGEFFVQLKYVFHFCLQVK